MSGARKPDVDDDAPAKFSRSDIGAALHHALVHASLDVTRPHLRGVQVKHMGGTRVRFAATDGHRVIAYTIQSETKGTGREAELLIDRDEVKTILASLKASRHDRVTIDFDRRKLRVGPVTFALTEPGTDVKFPPIEKVMVSPDRKSSQNVFLNPDYLAKALAACHSAGSDERGSRVRMNIGKQTDPLRFDVLEGDNGNGRECTVIVMPCRPTTPPEKKR